MIHVTSEYNDNAFLLTDSRKQDLTSRSPADVTSGRYAGMNSAGGVITIVAGAVSWRGPGLSGRSLEVRPEAAIAADLRNSERRNVELGLAITQSMPRGSEVRLSAHSTPSYFARNYLFDAIDANGDGTIADGERRYAAGRHRESEVSLAYRIRLNKATSKSPFGAAVRLGAGVYARTYEAPFSGRDLTGPTAEARLMLEPNKRFGIDLVYGFRSLGTSPAQQVMVMDETDVGRDLNSNFRSTDQNVRVSGLADYSRTEHLGGLRTNFELTSRSELRLQFERRFRQFSSHEATDFAHNGRRDARNQISAEMTFALRPGVRLSLGAEHATQVLRRGIASDVAEVDDYSRNRVALSLRFGF